MQPRLDNSQKTQPPGLLARVLTFAVAIAVIVIGFVFSLVVLAVVFGVGLVVAGYMWWRTRDLRKRMREQAASAPSTGGRIIEGEVLREKEPPGQ